MINWSRLLPVHIAVNGKVITVMNVNIDNKTMPSQNYDTSLIHNVMIREVMRITNLNEIHHVMIRNHALVITKQVKSLSMCIVCFQIWVYLSISLLKQLA